MSSCFFEAATFFSTKRFQSLFAIYPCLGMDCAEVGGYCKEVDDDDDEEFNSNEEVPEHKSTRAPARKGKKVLL